jgi:hypothetical protein
MFPPEYFGGFKYRPACALHADREGENFNRRNILNISRIEI